MRHFIGFELLPTAYYKKYPKETVTFVGRYEFFWYRIWRFNFMYKSKDMNPPQNWGV
jgi:hypothetical protein